MISIEELKQHYPNILDVKPYGQCIVVPGDMFDPDWEFQLEDQGYKVHLVELDRRAVALVSLMKKVGEGSEKLVYTPPPKPTVEKIGPGPDLIEKQSPRDVAKHARHKKYGDDWRPEEDSLLIELHKKHLPYWKIAKQLQEKFPNRTDHAIFYHISALLKAGKIKPRFERRKQRPRDKKVVQDLQGSEKVAVKEPKNSDKVASKEQPLQTVPMEVVGLLKEIRGLLAPKTFSFEHYCRSCKDCGVAEDSQVWKYCPRCGEELIVWNIQEIEP